jgi:hypothetical protein
MLEKSGVEAGPGYARLLMCCVTVQGALAKIGVRSNMLRPFKF